MTRERLNFRNNSCGNTEIVLNMQDLNGIKTVVINCV